MLASMRTTASSFVMKALMIFLVISFAVWGVGDIVRTGNNSALLTVGDETVSYPEYARAMNAAEYALQAQGITLDRRMLEDQVLQRLAEEKMVVQRLEEAGLEVNRPLLASHLTRLDIFKDVRGKFDAARFQTYLANRRINEAVFLDELASDIRAAAFTSSLEFQDLHVPAAFAKFHSTVQNERRDVVVFTIPASSVATVTPDEAALKEYYEANKALLYQMPERRTLEYVTFSAKDLAALTDKRVTEEDVADRIASDPDHYKDNEKLAREELRAEAGERVVDEITIAIEDALAAGETMGQAVAKAGLNARSQVLQDITENAYDDSGDALLRTVSAKGFTMLEGETSSIETTEDGNYFLVGVQEIVAAEPKPFETVKDDVAKRTAARVRNKALRERAAELGEALKGRSNWQEVAKEFGVTGRSVTNVSRTKSTLDAALTEAIFQHEVGDVAGPLLQENSAQMALITDSRFDAAPAKLDARAMEALNRDQQNEAMMRYYGRLMRDYPVRVNEGMMRQIRGQDEGA